MAGRPYGAPPPGSSSSGSCSDGSGPGSWAGPAWPGLGVATNGPALSFHITRFSSSKVSYLVCPHLLERIMTSTALARPGAVASPRLPPVLARTVMRECPAARASPQKIGEVPGFGEDLVHHRPPNPPQSLNPP